jgi:hypothetical protein
VPFVDLRLTCLVRKPYHLVAAGPKITRTRLGQSFRFVVEEGKAWSVTSSICAHSRCADRVVFLEAALLDELLGHYIASGEEDLSDRSAIGLCIAYCALKCAR